MANVYIIREDGGTEPMTRVHCKDEDRELQSILERNPDLLPGDQIDPEDPRRWLLVKREMPVPDPNTGSDRWSIDFFFVDQDAIPTFVECKRFADTRSRREVVGQMLEYAANGPYYWTKETIRNFAEEAGKGKGLTLEEALRSLQPTDDASADAFFERVQQNLREGQLRIVFFLEESPMELRSVVDFLNKQMERSEVLLVEARQYLLGGTRIVVPTLFGYTEEARKVKRSVTVTTAASRRKWDKDSFFADVRAKLTDAEVQALETLYGQTLSLGYQITWGTGTTGGSFNVKEPSMCPRSLLTVLSNGNLSLNFAWLNGSEQAERGRERLKELIAQHAGLKIPDDYSRKWPGYAIADWGNKVGVILEVLKQLSTEFRREMPNIPLQTDR
ncbi:MAG: hypothetical protein HY695_31415 [Deltaproteobacteria bacterium]|nr:hypothetical protein [Deltaproteobacteria bacterium]